MAKMSPLPNPFPGEPLDKCILRGTITAINAVLEQCPELQHFISIREVPSPDPETVIWAEISFSARAIFRAGGVQVTLRDP